VTKAFKFSGKGQLTVNAAPFHPGADAPMSIQAEVLDESGAVLAGYSQSEALAASGDSLSLALRWKQRADLAGLSGRPIRIVFHLFNTRFYSYRLR